MNRFVSALIGALVLNIGMYSGVAVIAFGV
jgi:hypothetical protein